MNGRYKEKLTKQFLKSLLTQVISALFIFVIILFIFAFGWVVLYVNDGIKESVETVNSISGYYNELFDDEISSEQINRFYNHTISKKSLTQFLGNYLYDAPIEAQFVLLNDAGEIIYYSGSSKELSEYIVYFMRLLFDNLKESNERISRTYKSGTSLESKWILGDLIIDESNVCRGALMVMISGEKLSNALDNSNAKIIVTKGEQRSVACTDPHILNSNYLFEYNGKAFGKYEDRDYFVKRAEIKEIDGYVYSAYSTENWEKPFIIAISLLIVTIILFGIQAKKYSGKIADSGSKSLEKLYSEMEKVKIDAEKRIDVEMEDEFGEIASQINIMLDEVKNLNEKALALEKTKNEIEMDQIKAKFHPHFIYNTLEGIRFAIMMNDNVSADNILLKLTQLLRYSVESGAMITLEEDIEQIKVYIDIMNFRMGGNIECSIEIDENTNSHLVPKLLIQPMVENSIKYKGNKVKQLNLIIKSWKRDGYVHIAIGDNGIGITEKELDVIRKYIETAQDTNNHFGIKVVSNNLRSIYGDDSRIEIESIYGKGTKVELIMREKV